MFRCLHLYSIMCRVVLILFVIICTGAAQNIDIGNILQTCRADSSADVFVPLLASLIPKDLENIQKPLRDRSSSQAEGIVLLTEEEIKYIHTVIQHLDISETPLGKLLQNGGRAPLDVFKQLDIGEIAKRYLDHYAAEKDKPNSSPRQKTYYADNDPGTYYELNDFGQCQADLDFAIKPLVSTLTCLIFALVKSLVPPIIGGIFPDPTPPEWPIPAYAWRLVDAAFKPPPGILDGKLYWVGDYDMCKRVEVTYNNTVTRGTRSFSGKYCKVNLNIGDLPLGLGLAVGVCVPDICTTENITSYINSDLSDFKFLGINVSSVFCGHNNDFESDTDAQGALAVLLILIGLVICASIYDGFFRKRIIRNYLEAKAPEPILTISSPQEGFVNRMNSSSSGIYPNLYDNVEKPPLGRSVSYVECHPEDYKRFSSQNGSAPTLKQSHSRVSFQSQTSVSSTAGLARNDFNRPLKRVFSRQESIAVAEKEDATWLDRLEAAFVGCSVYSSCRKMFKLTTNKAHFPTCDGIRVMSMMYAILGMTWLLGIIYTESWTTANLLPKILSLPKEFYFQFIINFPFCTDSMFVLSGFLITYHWLATCEKQGNKISWKDIVYFYLHKWYRLAVPMLLVLMFYACFYKYVVAGPLIPPQITDADRCKSKWWINMLMIQNLYENKEMCLTWTFYVPMLFQLHLITPLILIPLVKKPIIGYISLVVVYIAHFGATAGEAANLYEINKNDGLGAFAGFWLFDMMEKPWCRAGPYLVGIALGIVMFNHKKVKISWFWNLIGWAVSAVCLTSVIFASYGALKEGGEPWNKSETIAYHSLARTSWGFAIAWMIFSCENGHGGIVAKLLQYPAFQPLSRLCYMGMLLHAIFIFRNAYSQMTPIYIEFNVMLYFGLANAFLTFLTAFAFNLFFTYPFIGFEKAILCKSKKEVYRCGRNPLGFKDELRPTDSVWPHQYYDDTSSSFMPQSKGHTAQVNGMELKERTNTRHSLTPL